MLTVRSIIKSFYFLNRVCVSIDYDYIYTLLLLLLQNLCRNIFDLFQLFVGLLSVRFLVYVCCCQDEQSNQCFTEWLCKRKANFLKVSGLLSHFLLNTPQRRFSLPKAHSVTFLVLLNCSLSSIFVRLILHHHRYLRSQLEPSILKI